MIRCSMPRLLCVRLGAGPSSATLVNLHIVRRVALSQANIWSRWPFEEHWGYMQGTRTRPKLLLKGSQARLTVGHQTIFLFPRTAAQTGYAEGYARCATVYLRR